MIEAQTYQAMTMVRWEVQVAKPRDEVIQSMVEVMRASVQEM